jgi:ADP-heptose:LPS heptosyltransferase
MKCITFKNFYAPGDCLVFTSALRDLHLSYPFEFQISVQSCYPEIFYNNPNISNYKCDLIIELNPFEWKYENHNKNYHYSESYYILLEKYLNVKIERTSIYPEIFLTEKEKSLEILNRLGINKPYCVINAGFKNDMPLKQYPAIYWQQIVNELNIFNAFNIVQTGHSHHNHPPLKSVKNLIGKTDNIRDYFSLIYHSIGVICHVSFPMHIAAAFHKPCIVIGGGRENYIWEKYPDQSFLHTIGKLPCCDRSGCWKTQLNECENLTEFGPFCYNLIPPKNVISSVLSY